MTHFTPPEIAYLLLRISLGLNILLHGVSRLGTRFDKFVQGTLAEFASAPLPHFAVEGFTRAIPFLELGLGALILIGLFTLPALIAGTLMMMALMAGMCVLQKWEVVGTQLPYIWFYVALIYTIGHNRFALDGLRAKRPAEQ